MDESALAGWASGLAADLGIEQVLDVDAVLDLASDAAEHVVVVAADVPRVGDVVDALLSGLAAHPSHDGVVALGVDGRRQPLLAAHRVAPLRVALAGHEPLAHLSATRVTSGLDLVEIDVADVADDVDTPDDLHRLSGRVGRTEPDGGDHDG